MRRTTFLTLLLVGLGAARLFKDEAYLPHVRETSTMGGAGPTSISATSFPTPTAVSNLANLELRQAPGLVPAGAPPPVDPGLAPQADPGNPAIPAPAAAPANPVPAPQSPEALRIPPFDALTPANAPNAPAAPPPNAPAAPAPPPAHPVAPLAASSIASVTSRITTTSSLLGTPGVNNDFVSVQWLETWISGTQTWVPKTITFHFQAYVTQAPLPGVGKVGMGTLTGVPGQTKTVNAGAAPTQDTALLKGLVAALGMGVAGIFV